jgi:hypothetical protein
MKRWNEAAPVWKYIAALLPAVAAVAPALVAVNPAWAGSVHILQALMAFLVSVGLLHTTPPK